MHNYLITSLCGVLMAACAWFCLWVVAYYFVNDPELAIFFFPFALRLGIALHTRHRYWLAIYSVEWGITVSLALLLNHPQWLTALFASAMSIPVTWVAKHYYYGQQWRRFGIMAVLIIATSGLNLIAVNHHISSLYMLGLVSMTGGFMIVPTCYLLWSYLYLNRWVPLTSNLINRPVVFKIRDILFYSALFIGSIVLQTTLPDALRRFAPFCLAIPIILLAFRYGWQGALLATLLNSVALIAARSDVSNLEITDLLLSLLAQTLTGILLGMAVQRQKDLNRKLRSELQRNKKLARQLISAEESVRKEIARELHDEIGQNITAIRTQANIIKRTAPEKIGMQCANTIEQLSLNVYDTTKNLLLKLRPKMLDDLNLQNAIEQLIRDMEFSKQGTVINLYWQGDIAQLNDTLKITLFRLCQESLNNAKKYANASTIHIHLTVADDILLYIEDNGIGLRTLESMNGMGIKGMKERVQALGGKFTLLSRNQWVAGTRIEIQLPSV